MKKLPHFGKRLEMTQLVLLIPLILYNFKFYPTINVYGNALNFVFLLTSSWSVELGHGQNIFHPRISNTIKLNEITPLNQDSLKQMVTFLCYW